MRSYWMRILLGALAIWVIGMIGVTLIRRGKGKVESVFAGSGPLTFPLPFVPFQLEGARLGTMERVVINRDAPKKVSSIELQVKLDDSLVAQGLQGCRLAANLENDSAAAPGNLNVRMGAMGERTFFYCAGAGDSTLVPFGHVTLLPGGVTVPLLIQQSLAAELRTGRFADAADSSGALEARAESLAGKAERLSDSARVVHERMADSLNLRVRALGDSLRAEGRRRSDSVRLARPRLPDPPPPR